MIPDFYAGDNVDGIRRKRKTKTVLLQRNETTSANDDDNDENRYLKDETCHSISYIQ